MLPLRVLRPLMLVVFAITLYFNANATIGQTSSNLPCLLTPAGIAFSIWGIIYSALTIFVLRENVRPTHDMPPATAMTLYISFIFSCVCNVAWLLLFDSMFIQTSSVILVLLWLSLAMSYRLLALTVEPPSCFRSLLRVDIIQKNHHRDDYACKSVVDYLVLRVPFTLYFSWTSSATLINICLAMQAAGIEITTGIYCMCIIVLVGCHLAALLVLSDITYVAVGVWTLVWLAQRRASDKVKVIDDAIAYAAQSDVEFMAILSVGIIGLVFVFICVLSTLRSWQSSKSVERTPLRQGGGTK
jgi:benzodiazapine receptor